VFDPDIRAGAAKIKRIEDNHPDQRKNQPDT